MYTVACTHTHIVYIQRPQGTNPNKLYTHNQTYPIAIDFLGGGIWEIFLSFLFALWSFLTFSINEYILFVCFKK